MKLTKEDREKIVNEFNITERTLFRYKKNKEKEKLLKAFLLYIKVTENNVLEELEEIEAFAILCCKDKDIKEQIKEKINKIKEILEILD